MPYLGKSPSFGVRQRYQYTATASQTTFSGTDTANLTLNYTDNNFVDVYQNGVLLKGGGNDYTATSGTSVVLGTGATADDVIEIIVYDAFSAANFYNRTDSDSRYVRHDSGTLGTDNFIAGKNAGDAITSGGNENTLVGNDAGTELTTGDANVAVGYEALATEDAHGQNVAVGYRALKTLNAGLDSQNTAVGYNAGLSMTTGRENTIVGATAGDAFTDADFNIAIGWGALGADTKGNKSVAIGVGALDAQNFTSSTDAFNVAVGHNAGSDVTTGERNTFVGGLAGDAITSGQRNIAMGHEALSDDTQGNRSVAIGYQALAQQNHTSGTDVENVAIGHQAGYNHTTGTLNVCVGADAGKGITTGGGNTIVGHGGATRNTDLSTGNNNTLIGRETGTSATDASNNNVLGKDVVGSAENTFTFGIGSADSAISTGGTSISAPSDERYKEDIETSTAGLSFINDLRPVTFRWKKEKDLPSDHRAYVKDSEKRTMNDTHNHGFVAQEVKIAIDAHSELKDGFKMWQAEERDGRQRIAPAELIPILTKAIQELSAKNDALEARIKKLEDG